MESPTNADGDESPTSRSSSRCTVTTVRNTPPPDDLAGVIPEELKELRAGNNDFIQRRSQMDDDRKAKTLARNKVRFFNRRRVCVLNHSEQHAEACYEAENARSESRADELGDLRETRFQQCVRRYSR